MLFQIFILEACPDLHEMTRSDMRKHTAVNKPPHAASILSVCFAVSSYVWRDVNLRHSPQADMQRGLNTQACSPLPHSAGASSRLH